MNANTETTTAAPRRKRRLRFIVITVVVLLLLVYIASPYFSFWRFSVALRNADRDAIAAHVDFVSLRETMKHELRARFYPENQPDKPKKKKNRWESLLRSAAPTLIDTLVDTYITPDGVVALLAHPKLSASGVPSLSGELTPRTGEEAHQNVDWSNVHYAFFTSPRDFLVDAQGMKLHFRFSLAGWRLRQIDLPPDLGR